MNHSARRGEKSELAVASELVTQAQIENFIIGTFNTYPS